MTVSHDPWFWQEFGPPPIQVAEPFYSASLPDGRSLALPTFILGGAFLSSISSLLSNLVDSGKENKTVLIVLLVALYAVLFALGWCLLRGAAVARTRIKLALDEPLKILWDTVGAAGSPPKDEAMDYALYAFLILGLSAIVVPLILVVLFVR